MNKELLQQALDALNKIVDFLDAKDSTASLASGRHLAARATAMTSAKSLSAAIAQPVPIAPLSVEDARDAERWRYAVAIGPNQSMNWLDVYDDWNGEGEFTTAIDAAIAAKKADK